MNLFVPWDLTRHLSGWNLMKTKLSFANWLALNKCLVMKGTCNKLFKQNKTQESKGETKEDEPTPKILKLAPLLKKIWYGYQTVEFF